MSKSGAPYANFGAQMSTGALLFPTLYPTCCTRFFILLKMFLLFMYNMDGQYFDYRDNRD